MPIQFPLPRQDNPFDRWLWVRGAKPPYVQQNPNLVRPGAPFSASTLDGGFGSGGQVPVNLQNPGTLYQHQSGAVVPPADTIRSVRRIRDGVVIQVATRALGQSNMVLTGQSRTAAGAPLGSCQVLVFRTEDRSFVAETVSDANGDWAIPLMKGGPFFLVEYKAGAPDVAGTSVNTLVPEPA